MATNWTKPQETAIYDTKGTLLVSAAAGSGKTAVLVERAVQMILNEENPVDADRLLMVTFTSAAAGELKSRIAVRLEKAIRENPQNARLQKQKMLLQRANICTIDSFCMQLVKENFSSLGIPPDFTVLDTPTRFELRESAISMVLEKSYEDENFKKFVNMYGRARSDNAAKDNILKIYDYLQSVPSPYKTLDNMVANYYCDDELSNTIWGKELLNGVMVAINSALSMANDGKALIDANSEIEKYYLASNSDISLILSIKNSIDNGDKWDEIYRKAQNISFERLASVRGVDPVLSTQFKNIRENYKKILKSLADNYFVCTESEYLEDLSVCRGMVKSLSDACKEFDKVFYKLKLEKKMLEFSDFEFLSLRLLQDENGEKTPLAKELSNRFAMIMVDEYQDTNELQNALYLALAKEDKSNLFFVGDVKQSVYRFRKASPELFIKCKDDYHKYDGENYPATIILGHNFRSSRGVLHGVNDIFTSIMSRSLGEIDYNEDEALVPGKTDTLDDEAVEIHLVNTYNEDGSEAQYVANLIAKMIEDKVLVTDKNGGMRPCNFGDFCILLRSTSKAAPIYASALEKLEIPNFSQGDDSLLTQREIMPIVSLLQVIDNPAQDIAMASVMMSAMFGFTADELLELKSDDIKANLYSAIIKSENEKVKNLHSTLTRFRNMATMMSVDELCRRIMEDTGYFAAVGAMTMGSVKRENIRSFIELAMSYAKNGSGGLSGFLRNLDNAKNAGGFGSASGKIAPVGTVNIMTIHGSKGLEFPICILANCGKKFNLRDLSDNVLLHPKLGLGLTIKNENKVIFSTAPHTAIKQRMKEESLSEEMRLLYVALTRAKDKMIITSETNDEEKLLSKLASALPGDGTQDLYTLQNAQNMATWILSTALLHPNCESFRKASQGANLPLVENPQGKIKSVIATAQPFDKIESGEIHLPDEDVSFTQQLKDMWQNSDYESPISDMPQKVSVTDIVKSKSEHILKRPDFMYESGLSAAEKGTAMHNFLQYADFNSASENLDSEIKRLVEGEFILPEIAKRLDKSKVKSFLNSDTAKRIMNSEKAYREYPFITGINAGTLNPELADEFKDEKVLLQGIVDCIVINNNVAEIIDYKTDRNKEASKFVEDYRPQLTLYKEAIEKRLCVKVEKLTIYSLALEKEIDVS